ASGIDGGMHRLYAGMRDMSRPQQGIADPVALDDSMRLAGQGGKVAVGRAIGIGHGKAWADGWQAPVDGPPRLSVTRRRSVAVALDQVAIGIDAAVAQERPDAAHGIGAGTVNAGDQQLRFGVAGPGEELALRTSDEACTPELRAIADAAGVGLETDAVAGQHRQAVGDGMTALHGDPG